MDERIYTITLQDGTVLENLRMNGTCFVSSEYIDPDIFEYNTSPVMISITSRNGTAEETHKNMRFIPTAQLDDDHYYFALVDVPESDFVILSMQSEIDYLKMMMGVE